MGKRIVVGPKANSPHVFPVLNQPSEIADNCGSRIYLQMEHIGVIEQVIVSEECIVRNADGVMDKSWIMPISLSYHQYSICIKLEEASVKLICKKIDRRA